jgi:prolyl oligopeptidase
MTVFRTTLALFLGCSFAYAVQAQSVFPPAPVQVVTDTYFGTAIPDPYRWLEDLGSNETRKWMKAAADHADATLARIPGRDGLLARIRELESAAIAQVGRVIRLPGDLYVYESRGAQDNQFKIVMRRGLAGDETVLVDPQALSKSRGDVSLAVNFFSASPDGKYLAYGVCERGSEEVVLHLMETQSGRAVGEPITRADFGVARWAPDSKHFAFNRLREAAGDRKDKYEGSAVWLVPVDGGMAKAREILGPGTLSLVVRRGEVPTVLFTGDGRWLLGLLEDGVRREFRLAIAPTSSLAEPEPAWSLRIDAPDNIVDFAYAQGTLYAATHQDAPRYKFIAAPI